MSELDPTTLRRELLLQEGIDRQLDRLVGLATQTVLKLPANTGMEESQLRNLLNASIESGSVEVVTNFVRYQIARRKDDWQADPNGFGHSVINELYASLRQMTTEVVQHAQNSVRASAEQELQRLPEDDERRQAIARQRDGDIANFEAERDNLYVRLMQLYLGYLNRTFYFYKKSREWKEAERTAALDSLQRVVALSKERSNAE
jgi:hypothetical protein